MTRAAAVSPSARAVAARRDPRASRGSASSADGAPAVTGRRVPRLGPPGQPAGGGTLRPGAPAQVMPPGRRRRAPLARGAIPFAAGPEARDRVQCGVTGANMFKAILITRTDSGQAAQVT